MSAARSPGDWIGLVFSTASSAAADSRGRADAPAELSAPDVLTGTSAEWNSWPLSGVSRPGHLRVRVRPCGWAGLAGLPSWELVGLWQGEGRGFKFAGRLRTTCSAARSRLSCAGSTVI